MSKVVNKQPSALQVLDALLNQSHQVKTVQEIANALPYQPDLNQITFVELQNTLLDLGFELVDFDDRDADENAIIVQLPVDAKPFKWKDLLEITEQKKGLKLFRIEKSKARDDLLKKYREIETKTWFLTLLTRYKKTFTTIFILSFFIQVCALALPFFLMSLYNRLSDVFLTDTLVAIGGGAFLVIALEFVLRKMRAAELCWISARLEHIVNTSIVKQLVHLPSQALEQASIPAQISRLKSFEAVRDFFVSPLFFSILDTAFIVIGVFAFYLIAPAIVWIPIVAIFIYLSLAFLFYGYVKSKVAVAAQTSADLQNHSIELFEKHEYLRMNGLTEIWGEVYDAYAKKNAVASYQSYVSATLLENSIYATTMVANIAIIFFGVQAFWAGNMSGGAMFACILIGSRMFNLMHVICASIPRLRQLKQAIKQLNAFMDLDKEKEKITAMRRIPQLKGYVQFRNVGIRYTKESDPVVVGFNCDVKAGQIVAIAGGNGCGKSTILKLLLGIYKPQAGDILVDGKDIRQLEPQFFRQQIAYVPQHPQMFKGSIRDNLLMIKPDATEEELWYALDSAGALEDVEALPHSIDTHLSRSLYQIADMLHYKVNLARAYLKDAPIVLIDELPYAFLNSDSGHIFVENLRKWRGQKTIFIVSHWTEHIKLADIAIGLTKDHHAIVSSPATVLEKLSAESIMNEEYF